MYTFENPEQPNGKLLDKLIVRVPNFTNWVRPSEQALRKEYNVEYKNHISHIFGELWSTFEAFQAVAEQSEVMTISRRTDFLISNRSGTKSMQQLVDLVSGYRSWPEFRNMNTLADMIRRFKENEPMTMPIVISAGDGLFLMSGNTKLDIAWMMGIKPQALVLEV